MSDIVPEDVKQFARSLALDHTEWFIKMLRPFMQEYFSHGFRHGYEIGINKEVSFDWLNKLAKVEIKDNKYSNPTLTENKELNDSHEGTDQLHCHSKSNNPHENN